MRTVRIGPDLRVGALCSGGDHRRSGVAQDGTFRGILGHVRCSKERGALRGAAEEPRSLKRALREGLSKSEGGGLSPPYLKGCWCAGASVFVSESRRAAWDRGFSWGGGGCAPRVTGAHRIEGGALSGRELRREHSTR